jgi:hypothetical protein
MPFWADGSEIRPPTEFAFAAGWVGRISEAAVTSVGAQFRFDMPFSADGSEIRP